VVECSCRPSGIIETETPSNPLRVYGLWLCYFVYLGLTYGFPDALPNTVEHRVSRRQPKLLTTEHKQGVSILSICSGSRQVLKGPKETLGYAAFAANISDAVEPYTLL
jgi:hypothetical protein